MLASDLPDPVAYGQTPDATSRPEAAGRSLDQSVLPPPNECAPHTLDADVGPVAAWVGIRDGEAAGAGTDRQEATGIGESSAGAGSAQC
jgi:hypothetical protein